MSDAFTAPDPLVTAVAVRRRAGVLAPLLRHRLPALLPGCPSREFPGLACRLMDTALFELSAIAELRGSHDAIEIAAGSESAPHAVWVSVRCSPAPLPETLQ